MTEKRRTKPPHEPTAGDRTRVKTMAGMGLTQDDICAIVGISKPTLHKYYREELDVGAAEANAAVAQSLFKQATNKEKPNVVAGIFWMKARAGWRDQEPRDNGGKKEQKADAAKQAGRGRFAAAAPPLKVVR